MDRQFGVGAPNRLLVADFTYVKLISGVFVYVAFVIDAFSRRIVGWRAAKSMSTALVLDAIEHAFFTRAQEGNASLRGLIAHSDYAEVCVKPRIRRDGLCRRGLLADSSA